jgi:hypothetical protein
MRMWHVPACGMWHVPACGMWHVPRVKKCKEGYCNLIKANINILSRIIKKLHSSSAFRKQNYIAIIYSRVCFILKL